MNSNDEPSRALPVEVGAQPLVALIARVEATTGLDRDLNVAIAKALDILEYGVTGAYFPPPPFTTSLDAAIALVERVLPGWHWSLYDADGTGQRNAQLEPPTHSYEPFDGRGPTLALALVLALLRALQAQPIRHNARDGATPQNNAPSNAK